MSEERLELVRRVFEAVSAGEPAFELFTRDSEADFRDASPDQGVAQGPETGWTELLNYIDMFDGFRVELYDVIHADKDKVVTEARDGGRVKGSRAEVRNHYFHVFKFRGDKIARWSTHRDRNRALEAAGISQDPL
jgi:ketosteroid isomerase-like protein